MEDNDTKPESSIVIRQNSMTDDGLMSPAGYNAAAFCLFLIGFLGFFSNLIVIVLMCREKQLWTPLNVILFNLVMSDFSISILGNPFTLASAIAQGWMFGRIMCVVYGFFMSLLGISSITTLTVLSFERYLIISRPFQRHHLNHRRAGYLVFGIWVYALCLTTPPLLGWGEYINESANISCSVNWETRSHSTTSYIVFLFAFGLFVPVIVICFSYMNIIRTIKKNVRVMGSVTKAERKVALMVAVMIIAFFFAWTPYAILALLIAFADAHVAPWLGVVPALVAKSSICYNPIIYVGLNTQFRSAWRKLLGVDETYEVSGEMVGTLASPGNNVSRSLNKEIVLPRLLKKKANSETVLVQMDNKENLPVAKLYKNTKREQNGSRLSIFHQKTPKEKEKKKKKRSDYEDKDRNMNKNKDKSKSNDVELCYMGSRPENTL